MVISKGIRLKKKFGQHFLRDPLVVQHMLEAVQLNADSSVFEIGCGDGFLTRAILQADIARLWVFEIDPEWADYVKKNIKDPRLHVFTDNFLDIDFSRLESHKPWTVLSNLPYQVTFPILYRFQEHRHLLKEGVVMMQEEVAQKIMKTHGRGYGFPALFFQHFFDWKLLDKVPPSAFEPPPKVFSRLVYFKPREDIVSIAHEDDFWQFIKRCFAQPRRTLRNNLLQAHYDMSNIPEDTLVLRAQQMSMDDFLRLWELIKLTRSS